MSLGHSSIGEFCIDKRFPDTDQPQASGVTRKVRIYSLRRRLS
jgi:hypothetical protein